MRILQLFRKPSQCLRVALVGLLLAFALNSIAHAAHTHESLTPTTTHVACGYCATFGGLNGAPVYSHSLPAPTATPIDSANPRETHLAYHPASSAQARAPPIH